MKRYYIISLTWLNRNKECKEIINDLKWYNIFDIKRVNYTDSDCCKKYRDDKWRKLNEIKVLLNSLIKKWKYTLEADVKTKL